jgi:hypothetical protein
MGFFGGGLCQVLGDARRLIPAVLIPAGLGSLECPLLHPNEQRQLAGDPGTRSKCRSGVPGQASTVLNICALTDLDDIAVRIADVAADLAVLGNRRRDELGSSTFP